MKLHQQWQHTKWHVLVASAIFAIPSAPHPPDFPRGGCNTAIILGERIPLHINPSARALKNTLPHETTPHTNHTPHKCAQPCEVGGYHKVLSAPRHTRDTHNKYVQCLIPLLCVIGVNVKTSVWE